MPQANFVVKAGCSYGAKGQIVTIDVPDAGLTDRQKVMLAPYEAPEIFDLTDGEKEPEPKAEPEKELITATPAKSK